jgi:hypothetical protein
MWGVKRDHACARAGATPRTFARHMVQIQSTGGSTAALGGQGLGGQPNPESFDTRHRSEGVRLPRARSMPRGLEAPRSSRESALLHGKHPRVGIRTIGWLTAGSTPDSLSHGRRRRNPMAQSLRMDAGNSPASISPGSSNASAATAVRLGAHTPPSNNRATRWGQAASPDGPGLPFSTLLGATKGL